MGLHDKILEIVTTPPNSASSLPPGRLKKMRSITGIIVEELPSTEYTHMQASKAALQPVPKVSYKSKALTSRGQSCAYL